MQIFANITPQIAITTEAILMRVDFVLLIILILLVTDAKLRFLDETCTNNIQKCYEKDYYLLIQN